MRHVEPVGVVVARRREVPRLYDPDPQTLCGNLVLQTEVYLTEFKGRKFIFVRHQGLAGVRAAVLVVDESDCCRGEDVQVRLKFFKAYFRLTQQAAPLMCARLCVTNK